MSGVKDGLQAVLGRELEAFVREVERFPDDERLWRVVPGVTNSCGNLAVHVSGNLQHFVGAILGHSGYVRDRDGEFSRRSGTRAEVVAELRRAQVVVTRVLGELSDEALEQDYPEVPGGRRLTTGAFLLHLSAHLAHHLGQAGYLRRVLTGDNSSVGPVSIPELAVALEAKRRPSPGGHSA